MASVGSVDRMALFLASTIAGVSAGAVLRVGTGLSWATIVLLGFITALLHPLVGILVVGICEDLRNWSFPQEQKRWDRSSRVGLVALWPPVLLSWLLISPSFAIINRLFRSES